MQVPSAMGVVLMSWLGAAFASYCRFRCLLLYWLLYMLCVVDDEACFCRREVSTNACTETFECMQRDLRMHARRPSNACKETS
jgi:hypothetical protein